MNATEIKELFGKFGATLDRDDVWQVQSAVVIKHKALERLAASAGIRFDTPTVIRAERDEAVILATGRLGEASEWSIGEALVNVNYRVSGKQAGYVYAMAEKRAKDRVILKLAGLHGLYSEDEADEFKDSAPATGRNAAASPNRTSGGAAAPSSDIYNAAIATMRVCRSKADLREWYFKNKDSLAQCLEPDEAAQMIIERNAFAQSLPEVAFKEAAE